MLGYYSKWSMWQICSDWISYEYMITYPTKELNLPLVKASNIVTIFAGSANFTPLLGALIADTFAGRFWTITVGSIIYSLVSIFLNRIINTDKFKLIVIKWKYLTLNYIYLLVSFNWFTLIFPFSPSLSFFYFYFFII